MTKRVVRLAGEPDSKVASSVQEISALSSLVSPYVTFADVRRKSTLEAPRSSVGATEGTIIPELTSATLGCGLTMLRTQLGAHEITAQKFQDVVRTLLDEPRVSLDRKEMERLISSGIAGTISAQEVNALPPEIFKNPTIGFDSLSGNHFLGCYVVDEISDEKQADEWGLVKGSIVFAYHAEGVHAPFIIGRYFGQRQRFGFKERVRRFIPKALFHMKGGNWIVRYSYFFLKRWHEITLSSPEGARLFAALRAAQNVAYAHHLAFAARINATLSKLCGTGAEHFSTALHYTISVENIGDKEVVVHRNGSAKVVPGGPVMIVGHEDSLSYIGKGPAQSPEHFWNSAPYAYGALIRRKMYSGDVPLLDSRRRTSTKFVGKDMRSVSVPLVTEQIGEEVITQLEHEGVYERVVTLSPLYVYFGGRK